MTERRIKKRELREILSETNYGIDKLIAEGVLPKGRKISGNSHGFWLLSDVRRAERKLAEKFAPVVLDRPRISKPLSQKHTAQIRAAHGNQG